MELSQNEKVEKYQDLAREVRRIWQVKVKVIPIEMEALGTIPKALKSNLEDIGVDIDVEVLQKSVLLGTARILRKLLES